MLSRLQLFAIWMCVLSLLAPTRQAFAEVRIIQHARVEVDGEPVDLSPVVLQLNSYLVPLDKSVAALTHGTASVDTTTSPFVQLKAGDRVVARLPADEAAGNFADVVDPADPSSSRKLRLVDPPRLLKVAAGAETLYIGVDSLASLLGVTFRAEGARLSLFTPEYWCKQLGLSAERAAGRTVQNLSLAPDFGISPPAKTLLMWVRPARPAWVQVYAMSSGSPRPLFGVNSFGAPVTYPRSADTPTPREARPDSVLRAEMSFYGLAANQAASYVAVLTRDKPPQDPLEAIKKGDPTGTEFCVVGLQQTVTRSPIRYEMIALKDGQTLADAAAANRMPLDLLCKLNGLQSDDRVPAGTRLVVVGGLDEREVERARQVRYEVTDLYEVQPGDTTATLAQRCGVLEADFLAANAGVPPGSDLVPGELVNLVKAKGAPPKAHPALQRCTIQPMHAIGQLKGPAEIRQGSTTGAPVLRKVAPPTLVLILGKVAGRDQYRVSVGDTVGFMTQATMLVHNIQSSPATPTATGPAQLAARSALQYVGTPYVWGGNDLRSGIDCSHFVAAVFAHARAPVPSPPVHHMERYGKVVHWKDVPVEMFDRTVDLGKAPDVSTLQPGDRVIFQNDPSVRYDGNHHTGIYLGRLNDPRFGKLEHAVVHASSRWGVTVSDLVNSYLWRKYRYAVRGSTLRPAIAANASGQHRVAVRAGGS